MCVWHRDGEADGIVIVEVKQWKHRIISWRGDRQGLILLYWKKNIYLNVC